MFSHFFPIIVFNTQAICRELIFLSLTYSKVTILSGYKIEQCGVPCLECQEEFIDIERIGGHYLLLLLGCLLCATRT